MRFGIQASEEEFTAFLQAFYALSVGNDGFTQALAFLDWLSVEPAG